jgi:acyl-CoA synthetase (AMP-forming)/AMP-acid ligase II
MFIEDILKRDSKLFPNKVAVIIGNRRYTYKQFYERLIKIASALFDLGIRKGDRVAILSTNCIEYLELYFAVPIIGAILVPINHRYKDREILYIVNDAEPVAFIVGHDFIPTVKAIRNQLTGVEYVINLGKSRETGHSYEELLSLNKTTDLQIDRDENDTIIIMYTSGTTGKPKGAMLTHRSILSSVNSACIERRITDKDIYLQVATLCHIGGVDFSLSTIYVGGTQVILDKFDIKTLLEILQERNITFVLLVPTMIRSLLEYPDVRNYEFKNLRLIYYGAEPIELPKLREAIDVFKCDFMQGYGQTEASPLISILRPEDHMINGSVSSESTERLKSCGRQAINIEVKIVNQNGEEVSPGDVGEIIVKGDNVMKGYWKLPEETEVTLERGWLHTGDLGKFDDKNYIYIVGRTKDMIISGGENIYPKEIEDLILIHPAVKEVAVIGVPDEKWGEVPKALIVLKDGEKVEETEIIDLCREKLAGFKKPKSVQFVDSFPKSAVGKTLKGELKKIYSDK